MTDHEQSPVGSQETESLEDIIGKLLPTPSRPPPEAAPIPSDQDLLPVGTVTEEDTSSTNSLSDFLEGCFSCGVLTHTTDQCQTLDESFPFLPTGWQADYIGDQFILEVVPPSQQMGNAD